MENKNAIAVMVNISAEGPAAVCAVAVTVLGVCAIAKMVIDANYDFQLGKAKFGPQQSAMLAA